MGKGAIDRRVTMDSLLSDDVDYARPPRGGRDFFELLGNLQGRRVLDLGCGIGEYRAPLVERGARWVGLDLAGPTASVLGDAGRLPFRDAAFDAILCSAVLEHLPEPDLVMAEMRRVLKDGGGLFGYVAFLEPLHGMSYFHMTHLGLEYLLHKHGFVPERIFPSHVGAGYQMELMWFPRSIPLLQPVFRALMRGGLAVVLRVNRAMRQLSLMARGAPEAGDERNRRQYRELLALKYAVGINFISRKGSLPMDRPAGYRALIKG